MQLELGTVRESALSCLDFVIDFNEFQSRKKTTQLYKARRRKGKEGELAGDKCGSHISKSSKAR